MASRRSQLQQPCGGRWWWMGLLAIVSSCGPAADSNQSVNAANRAEEPASNLAAKVPLPAAVMDRASLLQAVAQARSAAAAGATDLEAQRQLDGKRFQIRIRFGCGGPLEALSRAQLGWTYDPKKRVLRVRAMPSLDEQDPAVAAVTPENVEAVEGFWVPRPWLMIPVCPAGPPPPPPSEQESDTSADSPKVQPKRAPAAGESPDQISVQVIPRTGIAQFFTAEDARTRRRDHRPYEAVKTMDEGVTIGAQGFDLVISGRLRGIGDGRVIRCAVIAANRPPDCIISARVDQVTFEDPASGESLAQWSSS